VPLGLEEIQKDLADIGNAHYGLGHGWAFWYGVNGRHWRLDPNYRFPSGRGLPGSQTGAWLLQIASNLNNFIKKLRLNDN
jgi:hypothetical protein